MTTMGAISVQEDWRIGGSKLHRIVEALLSLQGHGLPSEAQSWSPILERTVICRGPKPLGLIGYRKWRLLDRELVSGEDQSIQVRPGPLASSHIPSAQP